MTVIREKRKHRLWFSIKNKLFTALAVQLFVMLAFCGITYSLSTKTVISNYEDSTLTSLEIMADHFSYIIGTMEAKVLEYAIREDTREYVTGFIDDSMEKHRYKRNILSDMGVEIFNSAAIRSLRIIGKYGDVISSDDGQTSGISLGSDFYSGYILSSDLKEFFQSGNSGGWYGAHPVLDEATGMTDSAYSMFYVRNIIDFRSKVGIVILDVSKQFIMEALKNSNLPRESFTAFITDDGYETAYSEEAGISTAKGSVFMEMLEQDEQKSGCYYGDYKGKSYVFLFARVEPSGSCICTMIPEKVITKQVDFMTVFFAIGIATAMTIICIVGYRISRGLGNSVTTTGEILAKATEGELNVRIEHNRHDELGTISDNINSMLDTVNELMTKERKAIERSKEAEIRSLEAQVNPHFLYNTLDAINWVAIEQGAPDAAKMITNLAENLRYSIKNSNEEVTVAQEVEYLRKYLQLQQMRFKYSFDCILDVDEAVMKVHIHKMLLQPLIENAIEHAFVGSQRDNTINVSIFMAEEELMIIVRDNGVGMSREMVDEINSFDYMNDKIYEHIGIRNVATRIKMYYGEKGSLKVISDSNGTELIIVIPCEVSYEDSNS